MKIVKMHKGNKEAFDDFLADRLTTIDIDIDVAEKYFAKMNLPVPVNTVAKNSFFVRHKFKFLGLFILFSISFVALKFTLQNNNMAIQKQIAPKKYDVFTKNNLATTKTKLVVKSETLIKNTSIENNKAEILNIKSAKNNITVQSNNRTNNIAVLNKSIEQTNIAANTIKSTKPFIIPISKNKQIESNTPTLISKKDSVFTNTNYQNITKLTIKDSLYIIW